jgi:pyridoxamine 5'-phosphate oxidase family protein
MGLKEEVRSGKTVFSEAEAEYLSENIIGRVATISSDLQPHVVPVLYRFDGTYVYFGGWNLEKSLKYRHLIANNKVAFVVDDLASTSPWRPRGVEIRGIAGAFLSGGRAAVRIVPVEKRSWGLGA